MKISIRYILTAMLLLALTVVPFVCGAAAETVASGTCGKNMTWTVDDAGTLTISGTGVMDAYTYGSSTPWYSYREAICHAVVETGVTAIGNNAFASCGNLKSVILSDSVTTLGIAVFDGCKALETIVVPNSVTQIGAFAFSNCTALQEITLPDGIQTLERSTFAGCTALRKVTLPDCVTAFGWSAFQNCTSLQEFYIPAKLTSVSYDSFKGCTALTAFHIAQSNTAISTDADGALYQNSTLVFLPAFKKTGVYTVRSGVTKIGQELFYNCTGLTEVVFPDSVTTVHSKAFYGCTKLTKVTFGAGLQCVNSQAFQNCKKLEELTFPATLTEIGTSSFAGCSGVRKITFLGAAPTISSMGFTGVTASVTYPDDGTWDKAQKNYDGNLTWGGMDAFAGITDPQTQRVYVGEKAVFSVTGTTGSMTLQWQYQKPNTDIWYNSSSATQGYNTNTLTVEATTARNYFRYRCRITGTSGQVYYTEAAILIVDELPAGFTSHPEDQFTMQGHYATFAVTTTGNGLTYQWQYQLKGYTAWYNSSSYTKGYNTDTLQVIAEANRDGFKYRCRITDANGKKYYSEPATLDVDTPTLSAFATQPTQRWVMVGSNTQFHADLQGSIAKIQWQYQTVPGQAWLNSSSATIGYNTDTLTVAGAAKRNGFSYRCVVTDTDGYIHTSKAVQLTITKAQFDQSPADQAVINGQNAVFSVAYSGQIQSIRWQYSPSGGNSWYTSSSSFAGYNTASMTVPANLNRNGYLYRCVIIDADGNRIESDPAMLTVTKK